MPSYFNKPTYFTNTRFKDPIFPILEKCRLISDNLEEFSKKSRISG